MMPIKSRGCVKTVSSKFGHDQLFDMKSFVEMSGRMQWSKNEFSHRLSPEPGAKRRWRWPFRCRGSRHESAVALLLFS
jgi:hypothetical protein